MIELRGHAGFSRYIVRWLEFNHAEQQWVALRSWISAAVLLRDPPSDPPHQEITARPSRAAPRWPHACGRIPADLGAPPPLVPLEEVASALALIGFTEALQPTDVMDNTLSGVVQVRLCSRRDQCAKGEPVCTQHAVWMMPAIPPAPHTMQADRVAHGPRRANIP